MISRYFSISRCFAVLMKEFIQMRRDKATFGMMIGIPIMQLILFGFAINTNPKNLPTNLIDHDNSVFSRSIEQSLANTGYFKFQPPVNNPQEADQQMRTGKSKFIITIPSQFSKDLIRGRKPSILVEADATDPIATSSALSSLPYINQHSLEPLLHGNLSSLQNKGPAFTIKIHNRYNPQNNSRFNIVPGLIGVVLTLTMVMITALAITRETESGTMETLLATPVNPLEVMIGKIIPYIVVGYVQISIILITAHQLFKIPIVGNPFLLLALALPFIAANLSIGLTCSTIAKNQLQALQSSIFFFLPSLLLSGFLFPFAGMPGWAQTIGSALPLTHFLIIVRGILLKGNNFHTVLPELWPIILFTLVALSVGVFRYRRTLD